ncbi:MAG: hypothetical protein ACLVCW_04800, partial [Campylobacter sp.]
MNRNFIFNARKQGDSARNLNLRCGLGVSKRGFGAQRALSAYEHGHLSGASCDDLGARIDGLFRGTWRYDLDARGHELLRSSGCIDVGAGRHSLSQDTGHRGFITPKYELRSRANCDYSVSVLLNGAVCCDFAAQNSTKFSGDTYCDSSASTYSRCSSSASDCLRRVDANRDVHSRRDPSESGRLQSSMSVRSQRNFNAGVCLRRVGTKQGVHLYCKFGANRDAFPRCGFDACGLSAQFSAQKAVLSAYRSLFCDASRLGSEQNSAFGAHCVVRNFLNLHVVRDFKNFGSVNLKKFNLAASQFVNLKKQIRAGEGTDKSANPRNLTNFGHESRMLRRLGSESKIFAPRRFYFETALSIPCGSGLRHRGCEAAQNFKCSAPDFARNFKDFTRSLKAAPVQNFKISALNFIQNFWNSARGREAGSTQGFGNSGRNFETKFPQSAKNFKQNFEQNLLQRVEGSKQNLSQSDKKSNRNLEAEPVRGFKNQNSIQHFLQGAQNPEQNSLSSSPQNGKSYDQNSVQGFLQSGQSSDQSQKSKPTSAQSFKNQNFAWDFSQNGRSAESNSELSFSQSIKNSDRNFKANSAQNQTEPVSSQELKNPEPCPAQRLGFYAPKFKDERARNFFSHPMRAFVLCACFFAALGALSFLAPDALAIDYVGAHKFYFL